MEKGVLENFANFTRKHLCQGLFFNKVVLLYWDYFHSVPHSHCVKSVQVRSYFWSVFSCIRNRNNSVFGHFSRSENFALNYRIEFLKTRKVISLNQI